MLAHGASATGACYSRPVRAFRTALVHPGRVLLALLAVSLVVGPAAARQAPKPAPAPTARPKAVSPEIADAFAVGRMLALEGSLPESLAQLQKVAQAVPDDPYVQ